MKNADVMPENREHSLNKIKFFIERMTDAQLRLLAVFASSIFRNYQKG